MSSGDIDTLSVILSIDDMATRLQMLEQHARQQKQYIERLERENQELSHNLEMLASSPSGSTFCITSPREGSVSNNEHQRVVQIIEVPAQAGRRLHLQRKLHLFE